MELKYMDKSIATSVFQPIVSLRAETGYRIVGHEMLTRFNGYDTQKTIRSLEMNGQIIQFEKSLIFKAIEYAETINVPLSLNISNASISDDNFLADFNVIASTMNTSNLNIEITETHAPNLNNLKEFSRICHENRINIGLDDFGAGHANMKLLSEVDFNFVKIDGSITKAFDHSADARGLLADVLAFTADKGMTTTIEFIENATQMLVFESLGIEKGQGYFFGEPKPTPLTDQEIRMNMLKNRIQKPSIRIANNLNYGS
jgi:EAL domain-containing protein (putative c-di-GMP-specific phosphodiesterase class I)